jgi:hypothetical protein
MAYLIYESASSCRRLRGNRMEGRLRFGCPRGGVELPEKFPEVSVKRVRRGIARNDRADVRPLLLAFDEVSSHRIGQNIKARLGKRVALALLLAEYAVVRLMLPSPFSAKRRLQIGAEEFHGVQLVRLAAQTHPHKMEVVRHQAICRAAKPFTRGGVKHHFPESGMKRGSEPAASAGFQCVGPEHNGMALIMMPYKARQVPFAFDSHAACISPRCDGVKHGMPKGPSARSQNRREMHRSRCCRRGRPRRSRSPKHGNCQSTG